MSVHTDKLINEMAKNLNEERLEILGLADSFALNRFMIEKGHKTFAFIQFDDTIEHLEEFPTNLEYKIGIYDKGRINKNTTSWYTDKMMNEDDPFHVVQLDNNNGSSLYYSEGFVAIQHAVTLAFIKLNNLATQLPEITLRRFPTPSVVNVHAREFRFVIPALCSIMFLFCFINITNVSCVFSYQKQIIIITYFN